MKSLLALIFLVIIGYFVMCNSGIGKIVGIICSDNKQNEIELNQRNLENLKKNSEEKNWELLEKKLSVWMKKNEWKFTDNERNDISNIITNKNPNNIIHKTINNPGNPLEIETTPLFVFLDNNGYEIGSLLIELGANINCSQITKDNKYEMNEILFQYLIDTNNEKSVKLLINAGIDLDVIWEKGYTPLISAIIGNHPNIVKFLLENGANPDMDNGLGNTAKKVAEANGNTEIINLFK